MRPVCVRCKIEMKCVRNGFPVFHGGADPKAFSAGDRYRCQGCGAEIVTSFGQPSQSENVEKWRMIPITIKPFKPEEFPSAKIQPYDDGCSDRGVEL